MKGDQPPTARGLGIPPAGTTTYSSYGSDGRYQPHASLYMQRGLAHSGQFTGRRPSTAMQGARFQSMPDGFSSNSAQRLGTIVASTLHSSLHMHALASQEVMASQMAAQLLAYAGHPAFASYMRVRSELPTDYYDQPQLYLSQVAEDEMPVHSTHHAAQHAQHDSCRINCNTPQPQSRHSAMKSKAVSDGGVHVSNTAEGARLPVLSPSSSLNSSTANDSLSAFPSLREHVSFSSMPMQQHQKRVDDSVSTHVVPPRTPQTCMTPVQRSLTPSSTASAQSQVMRSFTPASTASTGRSGWGAQPGGKSSQPMGNTRAGWVNTLGDYYDSDTSTWLRLPCEVPTEQLPKHKCAVMWHTHKVLRRVFNCWRLGVPALQHEKQCKEAKAASVARRTLLSRCLSSFQIAVSKRQVKEAMKKRAWLQYSSTLKSNCLHAWQSWFHDNRVWQLRQQVAVQRLSEVRVRMIMDAWHGGYVQEQQDKRILNAWAAKRIQAWRMWLSLYKLKMYRDYQQYKKRQGAQAVQHRHNVLAQRVLCGWWSVLQRSRRVVLVLQRADRSRGRKLVAACFKGWQVVLLEAVREALTEQVYDLKAELQHAVAWSD